MNSAKVLHVIGGGEVGGAEIHVLNLLREMNKDAFQPRVCCLCPEPFLQLLQREAVQGFTLDMRSRMDFSAIPKLAKYMKEEQITLLHTHGVRANLVGRLASRLAGVPVSVTTVHSVLKLDYPKPMDRWFNYWVERLTAPLTHRFIAVSDSLKKDLVERGVPEKNISVIYNGIPVEQTDLERIEHFANSLRRSWQLQEGEVALGMIARFHPVKGHRFLLEAVKHLNVPQSSFKLILVGDGQLRSEIEQLVGELGLDDQVVFAGFAKDVKPYLQAMDVVVVPSLSEGFGLSAVEAMAFQKPVIATRVGGLEEIIQHQKNGLLVSPGDSLALAAELEHLIGNARLRQQIAKAGQERVFKDFTLEKMVDRTQAVYTSMLWEHRKAEELE